MPAPASTPPKTSRLLQALIGDDPLPAGMLPILPSPGTFRPGANFCQGHEFRGLLGAMIHDIREAHDDVPWMLLNGSFDPPRVGGYAVLVRLVAFGWRMDVEAMPDPLDFDNARYVGRIGGVVIERVQVTRVEHQGGFLMASFELDPWWTDVDEQMVDLLHLALGEHTGHPPQSLPMLAAGLDVVLGETAGLLDRTANTAIAMALDLLRNSPPGPAPTSISNEELLDVREQAFAQAGVVRPTVLAPMINPAFTGGVRWPALRQAFRLVDCEDGILMATEGLSDVDDQGYSLGIELYAKSGQPGGNGPEWLYRMVKGMGDVCAQHPELPTMLERLGLITVSLHPEMLGEHSQTWQDQDGGITVLVGLDLPGVPHHVAHRGGSIRLASIVLLRPEEAALARVSPGHTQALGDKLLEHPPAWVNDLQRDSVI